MLDAFDQKFGDDIKAFRAILPEGTEIVAANAVSPAFRYFAGDIDHQLNILPQDERCAAPGYVPPAPDGSFGPKEAARFRRIFAATRRKGKSFVEFGLAIPEDENWPSNGSAREEMSVVFKSYSRKDIAFCVDRDSGAVAEIVKLPLNAATRSGCAREFRMLADLEKQGRDVAPKPIGAGKLPPAGGGRGQPFTAQTYLAGRRAADLRARTLHEFLEQLKLPDETISLADLAGALRPDVETLKVPEKSRRRIDELLNLVTDSTKLPAAIGHGDCWEDNFILRTDGRLGAVDWENSRRKWLGFLDVIQAVVCENYIAPANRTPGAVFTPEKLRILKRQYANLMPPGAPALEEFLTFHVCHHYVDRVVSFGGLDRPGLLRLDKLIHEDLAF